MGLLKTICRHINAGTCKKVLHQFNNKIPNMPQYQIYPYLERTYGADAHKIKLLYTSPSLPTYKVNQIERIVGKLLYYAREGPGQGRR